LAPALQSAGLQAVAAATTTDRATVVFSYADDNSDPTATPVLAFLDPVTHTTQPVRGSAQVPDALVLDSAAHTFTVVFDATSTPRLNELPGTVFSVLRLPTPAPDFLAAFPSPQTTAAPSQGLASGLTADEGVPAQQLVPGAAFTIGVVPVGAARPNYGPGGAGEDAAARPDLAFSGPFLDHLPTGVTPEPNESEPPASPEAERVPGLGASRPHDPETLARLFATTWRTEHQGPDEGAGHEHAALLSLAGGHEPAPELPRTTARPALRFAEVALIALVFVGGHRLPSADDLNRLGPMARRRAPRRWPIRGRLPRRRPWLGLSRLGRHCGAVLRTRPPPRRKRL
jgi:hypothetical protein